MEISLDDLLILEPRLGWGDLASSTFDSAARERAAVSWVVSARTTPPHLPLLRGGEVVLVSSRVAAVVGAELPALLREAMLRDVVAVVFESGEFDVDTTDHEGERLLILQWFGDLTADTETSINRLLTECRGNLYRIGSELERQMTDHAANRSGMAEVVRVASGLSGLPILVSDAQGRQLAASFSAELGKGDGNTEPDERRIVRELASGWRLVLGPLRPEQQVLGRFLVDRIAAATSVAARRDDAARPRGMRRVEAVEALLAGQSVSASDQRSAAIALGLDPDAVFVVAVTAGGTEATIAKALAPLGTIQAAGGANGRQATLVAASGRSGSESLASRIAEVKKRWEADTEGTSTTLALSAPAFGVARLPAAAREAEFVATLQAKPRFPRRAASFESIEDVGAFRVLFQLRDTNELRQFVSEVLGTLEFRDQRGTLRQTLRAFLESGGSQVDASNRLGIHRNTLAYRLRRIGELVGRDVADPGSWLTLHLALRAAEMIEVCSDEH
jgi:purine catabolism regulator